MVFHTHVEEIGKEDWKTTFVFWWWGQFKYPVVVVWIYHDRGHSEAYTIPTPAIGDPNPYWLIQLLRESHLPKTPFASKNRNTSLFCYLTAAQVRVDHCEVGRGQVFHAGPPCHLIRMHTGTGKQLFSGEPHSFLPVSTARRKVWTGPEGKEKAHLLSLS